MTACLHCAAPVPENGPAGPDFCCRGCRAAHAMIKGMGLGGYYARRVLDPEARPLRPDEDEAPAVDFSAHVRAGDDGTDTLYLIIEGMHCAACVWLIEGLLARREGVVQARVNMTTRRLTLRWKRGEADPNALLAPVLAVGYRLAPYDPEAMGRDVLAQEQALLRAMAVAGFAAGNIMLFSISIWFGTDMDPATRHLMHWLSALIALPAVAYAIRPFLRSAMTATRAGRMNMDVPITIGVLMATGISLFETIKGGPHAYFDSAVMLLFFLLVGRYLDSRARGRARSAAEHLLGLNAVSVTVIDPDGTRRLLPPAQIRPGMTVLCAPGERIGVDGRIIEGVSEIDSSLISGETVPNPVKPGERVFAGTLNLSGVLRIEVDAVGERTLLAEIVRMLEAAEQGRARYVAVADRVARLYGPVVQVLALATFLGWLYWGGVDWQQALLYAVATLIITCPCALALAVPVVQVVASGRLMRRGVLVKSPTALERMAEVTDVVFDKTGTITLGRPELARAGDWDDSDLRLAARIAGASRHPLARALTRAVETPENPPETVREMPGLGLAADVDGGEARIGSRAWCGVMDGDDGRIGPELWLRRPDGGLRRFLFTDPIREDAAQVVRALKARGLRVELLSGDRAATVGAVAKRLGLETWRAGCTPADKCARLDELAASGRRVMMVGDGLNDAPALAAAHVSMSPGSAMDVSQNAADMVFQGLRLAPVSEALAVARRAERLVKHNFAFAFTYNVVSIPLAVMGLITPLVAALAMSSSSVVVIVNALRLADRGRRKTESPLTPGVAAKASPA